MNGMGLVNLVESYQKDLIIMFVDLRDDTEENIVGNVSLIK